MSRILHSGAAKDMPVALISKNLSNVSAYWVQCQCGRPLGSLGQFAPDVYGRRTMFCDTMTPEQVAKLIEAMGMILTPDLSRKTEGCGAITVIGKEGQIEKVFLKGSAEHTAIVDIYRKATIQKNAQLLLQSRSPRSPQP
jgi:hypothetical protein